MSNNKVAISRGEVVGVGELKVLSSKKFLHKIPMLSFLVVKTNEGFVSSCIQLHMDGYGKTPDAAKENMCKNCIDYVIGVFNNSKMSGKSWTWLHELFKSDERTIELLNAYNNFKLYLCEEGEEPDMTSNLLATIARLEQEISLMNDIGKNEKQIARLKVEIEKLEPKQFKSQGLITEIYNYQKKVA